MPLITFFTAPKPFSDPRIATIQRNAIESWIHIPNVETLLIGEEEGLAQTAREMDVRHLSNVALNADGTPLISSMFRLARENSHGELLCIINTDILLMPDFVEAAQQVMKLKDRFVLVSRRWDLDVTQPIDFSEGWQERLRARAQVYGHLHKPAGSDFFLFPISCYQDIPDFAIGRAGWDNWMIYKARKENWPVIDGTPSLMAIHQNHDYSHLPGGKPHYDAPETNENIRLAGGHAAIRFTVLDATCRLINGKLARPAMSYLRFMRSLELLLRAIFYFLPKDRIENIVRPKRWMKRIKRLFK